MSTTNQPSVRSNVSDSLEPLPIFVSNSDDSTISVIPVGGNHVVATIPLHDAHIFYTGNNMYLSPDGTNLNVVTYGNNSASIQQNTTVISTASDTVIGTRNGTILMGQPVCLSSNGKYGYFSGFDNRGIYKILTADSASETETLQLKLAAVSLAAEIPVYTPHNHSFALSPDSTKFYILDSQSSYKGSPGNVVWVVPAAGLPDRMTSTKGKIVPVVSAFSFGATSLAIPQEDAVIPVGRNPFEVAVSSDSSKVYVTNEDDDTLTVISASGNTVTAVIPVGHDPRGVAVSPDGGTVYVVNHGNDELPGSVSLISTAANKVIGTIRVGRGPVGIAVSGKSAAPAQDIYIRTDANRDGTITFADKDADETTPDKPYTFWLNDNIDGRANGEWEDQDPAATSIINASVPSDNHLAYIENPRDFEDFERLQIKLPSGFSMNADKWKITLQFTEVGKTAPAINLVPTQNASLSYLTNSYDEPAENTKAAVMHFSKHKIGPITKAEQTTLPLAELNITENNVMPLLFEGVKEGQGKLTVRIYKSGTEVGENFTYLRLLPITKMYSHYTADPREYGRPWQDGSLKTTHLPWQDDGDSSQVPLAQILTTSRLLTPSDELQHDNNYILFVHGWRMKRWERIAFAQTAFKRLWHLGYKGHFGFFSWPTEYTTTDIPRMVMNHANYDDSEWKAYTSAQALHSLLTTLSQKYTVCVFAHSMGNVVTSEALRLESEAPSPRKLVQTYVASQAAVAAQAYDVNAPTVTSHDPAPNVYAFYPTGSSSHGTPYFGSIGKAAGNLVNFFNPDDYALTKWRLDQSTKPDRGYTYVLKGLAQPNPNNHLSDGFYRGETSLVMPQNAYEIFAKAAPAYSLALGAQTGVGGPFSTLEQVDLNQACGFTKEPNNHSAQFEDTFSKRQSYWKFLLKAFGLGEGTPN